MTQPKIDHYERYAPDRIQDVTIDGVPGCIFTVNDGDVLDFDRQNIGPGGQPNERCEISYAPAPTADKVKSPYNVKEGMLQTYDLRFAFYSSFPSHRWAMIAQFHPRDDLPAGFKGFTGVSLHGSNVTLVDPNDDTGTVFFVSRPIQTITDFNWRLVVKWTAAGDGFVKVVDRLTSELLGRYDGATIPAGSWSYLKQGLYRDGASTAQATIRQTLVDIHDGDLTVQPLDQARRLQAQLAQQLAAATDTNTKLGVVLK